MSERAVRAVQRGLAVLALLASAWAVPGEVPRLGRPVAPAQAARADLSIFPDGRGLPPGSGNARTGRVLYERQCAACHGAAGRGGSAEELAGGSAPLTAPVPDKTIGLYWPYATTLFDYTWRAMPMQSPGSLTPDEVYALTAYLLQLNGLFSEDELLDARRLVQVRMPNRRGFVGIDATVPDDGALPAR